MRIIMISFTVLYPYGADKKFDWDYYLAHHMEGLKKLLGGRLLHYHLEKGLSGVESGTPPAFFAILHVLVKGMEDVEVLSINRRQPFLKRALADRCDEELLTIV